MKYSYELLLKCNGLRFKAVIFNAPTEGVVMVEDGCVYLCYRAETYRPDHYNRRCIVKVAAESDLMGGCIENLEIVPRDPDTYTDFQVGDRLFAPSHPVMEVVFRSGEVVALKGLANGRIEGSGLRTCRELFEDGYRLVPTNIEEELENNPYECKHGNAEKKAVENTPKPYEFKKGEPVLVRDYGGFWKIKAFTKMQDSYYKYMATTDGVDDCGYRECLPYNERTMHLLGTTGKYKEE